MAHNPLSLPLPLCVVYHCSKDHYAVQYMFCDFRMLCTYLTAIGSTLQSNSVRELRALQINGGMVICDPINGQVVVLNTHLTYLLGDSIPRRCPNRKIFFMYKKNSDINFAYFLLVKDVVILSTLQMRVCKMVKGKLVRRVKSGQTDPPGKGNLHEW